MQPIEMGNPRIGADENSRRGLPREEAFQLIRPICFRDLVINDVQLRILGVYRMDASENWHAKPHRHPFFEFHYVFEGKVFTRNGEIGTVLEPGMFYLLPPNTRHEHRGIPGTRHTGYVVRWEMQPAVGAGGTGNSSGELARAMTILQRNDALPMPAGNNRLWEVLLSVLDTYAASGSVLQTQLAFIRLILEIAASLESSSALSGGQDGSEDRRRVDLAARYIEAQAGNPLSASQVAAYMHISYSHLSRMFKRLMGDTIQQYIFRTRIDLAEQMLLGSNASLKQVAEQCGFGSEAYLCRAFKQYTGMTPIAYRNHAQRLMQ